MQDVLIRYHREMSGLAQVLMSLFALGLGLGESFFDDKIDRYISRLRIRNYSPPAAPPRPGQIRSAPIPIMAA
jgi:isopenicillin N synthase-like dioxygenase